MFHGWSSCWIFRLNTDSHRAYHENPWENVYFPEDTLLGMSVTNEKVSFEVKFLNSVRDVYKFEGTCFKENVKVSEAEFSAMITYK